MEKIIEIQGLTKKYGSFTAVDNLNLNVYAGDVFGFLGPNGAGKSTTIRMMLSLIKPTSGNIKIFGMDLKENREKILSGIGAIVEKPDFYKYLSAYRNLEILGEISGRKITKKRIFELLELVGLEKRYKSKVKTYSHGMKQRLGIAQALLHDPDLIILDEPTTGLDPQGMKEIRDLILTLSRDQKKTVFLSSHILREVELIADRMIIINKGQTKVEGSVKELLKRDGLSVTFGIKNSPDVLPLLKNSQYAETLDSTNGSSVTFNIAEQEIPALNRFLVENGAEINFINPVRSLEDYFLKITGSEK